MEAMRISANTAFQAMGQATSKTDDKILIEAPVEEQPLPLPVETMIVGVGYGLSLPIAQYAGKICRISCATPVLSTIFGAASVAFCSTSSLQVVHEVQKLLGPDFTEASDLSKENHLSHLLLPALIGMITFKTLGGKYRNLLPSDVRYPGAHAKAFIPASGGGYANTLARFVVKALYKQFGCHHCGKITGESIADHIPPTLLHTKSRRLLKVTQRFYPQCTDCMKVQSAALRHGSNPLVLHRKHGWPEPYLFSGFLLAALQPNKSDIDKLQEELSLALNGITGKLGTAQDVECTSESLYAIFKRIFGGLLDP